VYESLGPLW